MGLQMSRVEQIIWLPSKIDTATFEIMYFEMFTFNHDKEVSGVFRLVFMFSL